MADSAFALQIIIAFGGGVISFLSPCVLPLVPGYLAMMTGYSAGDLEADRVSRSRVIRATGLFVLGFTAVFAAFGATATTLGRFLSANLPFAGRVAGGIVVAFGLAMLLMAIGNRGWFGFLQRDTRPAVRPSRLGAWAPPVMGAAFAFGWTPCIGPILTVVLTTAATRETLAQGVVLLIGYSFGLGVPFLLAALGVKGLFRRAGRYLRPLNIGAAVILTLFGLVMLTGNLNRLSTFFTDIMVRIPFLERLSAI
jgi:cytochrome c-type biogenesis protein